MLTSPFHSYPPASPRIKG